MSSDPAMDGINWYGYVGGNPLGAVDPLGLEGISDWNGDPRWKTHATKKTVSKYLRNNGGGGSRKAPKTQRHVQEEKTYNEAVQSNDSIIDEQLNNMSGFGELNFEDGEINPDDVGKSVNFNFSGNGDDFLSDLILMSKGSYYENSLTYKQKVESGYLSKNGTIIPTKGIVTSPYGNRTDPITKLKSFHNGIDIAGAKNSGVFASSSGAVVYNRSFGDHGNMVVIKTLTGHESYSHLSYSYLIVGQKIDAGDLIGGMGTTGRSTGIHLHFTRTVGTKSLWGYFDTKSYESSFFQQYEKGKPWFHINNDKSINPF